MRATKIRCLITRGGETAHYNCDTVIIDGVPYLVLEWAIAEHGEEVPNLTVRLDPKYFHELKGWGEVTHMYELPITDPRG
ncbi:MAG: hypothetical protein FJX72_15510 [Armatimonadetes bacterium]|nr:hypothetical protein [Armatimonadota bacterium]